MLCIMHCEPILLSRTICTSLFMSMHFAITKSVKRPQRWWYVTRTLVYNMGRWCHCSTAQFRSYRQPITEDESRCS